MNESRLIVSIDDQKARLFSGDLLEREFTVSTAEKGVGFAEGSHRTPVGRFVVVEKIGDGVPEGTIFVSREPVGRWTPGDGDGKDLVLTRIIRISGLEPENANTFDRYIYFHGTNQEDKLGEPASCGCIRLSNSDIIELHDLVRPGMTVVIEPPTRPRGKLIFFDCDSTLSTIEGIDELARARGSDVFRMVEELTNRAMNGEVPIHEVFGRRMEIIQPDRPTAETVARLYIEKVVPGAEEVISQLKSKGWTPVILSGGFAPLIRPLADHLGIRHVEAVPLEFDSEGRYSGYGMEYPTTRNGGKPEIIRQWRDALLPEAVVMVGDGVSDLETRGEVDLFIGFGGVVRREAVRQSADAWIESMSDFGNVRLPDSTRRER